MLIYYLSFPCFHSRELTFCPIISNEVMCSTGVGVWGHVLQGFLTAAFNSLVSLSGMCCPRASVPQRSPRLSIGHLWTQSFRSVLPLVWNASFQECFLSLLVLSTAKFPVILGKKKQTCKSEQHGSEGADLKSKTFGVEHPMFTLLQTIYILAPLTECPLAAGVHQMSI